MKRYFIVPAGALPHECKCPPVGEYHYIDLDSHPNSAGTGHRVLVQMDGSKPAPADWQELPHLLDAETKLGHDDHVRHLRLLSHLGALPEHGAYSIAKRLARIHPHFKP